MKQELKDLIEKAIDNAWDKTDLLPNIKTRIVVEIEKSESPLPEKKFQAGAKARITPKVADAFFVKGDTVTIKYNFMLDRWVCAGRSGCEGILSEEEMELI